MNQRPSLNDGIGPPVRQQSVINGSVIKVEAQVTVTNGVYRRVAQSPRRQDHLMN
jgi:hypothetical protein